MVCTPGNFLTAIGVGLLLGVVIVAALIAIRVRLLR